MMRQTLDEKSTSEELRVLNEFRDEVVNLISSIPMMSTQCQDTLQVINCLRFIKVNEDFIRYAFEHPEDMEVYTFQEDKEKDVLRDDNGTAFHINRKQGRSANDYIRSLNNLIEQVEGAFEIVREHGQIRTFVQSFLYDGDIGCLEARTSSALLFASYLSDSPEFIDFDAQMLQVAQNFVYDAEKDAQMVYKAFEHYQQETFRHGDSNIKVTWEYIQNYMQEVLGFSERSPYEVRNLLHYERRYEDVITQMRENRSGIKLVSCPIGENTDIDFLLDQLADSAHVRPPMPLSNHNSLRLNRARVRDTKDRDSWSDREVTLPRGRDKPGRQYIKKTSLTYQDERALNKVYQRNRVPVGIHFDLDKCDFKNDKYCWTENAFSVQRWWIEGHNQADHYFAQSVTFEELKGNVMVHGSEGFVLPHNEILVCPSRESVSGVFATEDTLLGRLNALRVMLMIRKKLNTQVPVYVHVHPLNQILFTRAERTITGMLGKLFDAFSMFSDDEVKQGEQTVEMKGCARGAESDAKHKKEVLCKKYRIAYLAFLPYIGQEKKITPYLDDRLLISWEIIKDKIDEYCEHPEFNDNEMAYIECRPREYTLDDMKSDIAEAETTLRLESVMNEIITLKFQVAIVDRMVEELSLLVQRYPSFINKNNILDIIDLFSQSNMYQEIVNIFRYDIMRIMSTLINLGSPQGFSILIKMISLLDEGDEQVEALSKVGHLEPKEISQVFVEYLVDMGINYSASLPIEYHCWISSFICRTDDKIRIYLDQLSSEARDKFLLYIEIKSNQKVSSEPFLEIWRSSIENQTVISKDICIAIADIAQENNDEVLVNEVFDSMLSEESLFLELRYKMDKEKLLNFISHIYLDLDMEYSDNVLGFLINSTFDIKEGELPIDYYEQLACYLIDKQKTDLIDVFCTKENDCLRRVALFQIVHNKSSDVSQFSYLLDVGDSDSGGFEKKKGTVEDQSWTPGQVVSFLVYALDRGEYDMFDQLIDKHFLSISNNKESQLTLLRKLTQIGNIDYFSTLVSRSSRGDVLYLLNNLEGISEAGCIEIYKKAINRHINLSEMYENVLQSGSIEAISGIASQADRLSTDQISTLVDRRDSLSQNAKNSLASIEFPLPKGCLISLLENSTDLSEDAFHSLWLTGLCVHLTDKQNTNDLLLSLHASFISIPAERRMSLVLKVLRRSSENNVMSSVYRAQVINFLLDINIWALSGYEGSEVLTSETKVSDQEYSLSMKSPSEDSRHPFSLSPDLKRKKNMAISLLRQWVPLIESLPLLERLRSLLLNRSHWVKIMRGGGA